MQLISGGHLTAFDRRALQQMHERAMTSGATPRKRFTLSPSDKAGEFSATITEDGRTWRYVVSFPPKP